MKSVINNACHIALEYCDTKQKWFCLETNQKCVVIVGSKTNGDMHTFNTDFQRMQTRVKKQKMIYPGDV